MVIQVVDYLHRSLVLVNDLLGPIISKAKGGEHTVEVGDPEKKDLLDGDSIVQPPVRSVSEMRHYVPMAPMVPLTAGRGGGLRISFICCPPC